MQCLIKMYQYFGADRSQNNIYLMGFLERHGRQVLVPLCRPANLSWHCVFMWFRDNWETFSWCWNMADKSDNWVDGNTHVCELYFRNLCHSVLFKTLWATTCKTTIFGVHVVPTMWVDAHKHSKVGRITLNSGCVIIRGAHKCFLERWFSIRGSGHPSGSQVNFQGLPDV